MTIPLPVLPGVYYARVHGSWDGRPSGNILALHRSPSAGSTSEDSTHALDVATAIASAWVTFAAALYSNTYLANMVTCYPLGSPTEPAAVSVMTAPGTSTQPLAAATAAILVSREVHRRGRGSQSRLTISPVTQVALSADGGSITPTVQAQVQTAVDNLMADILTNLSSADPMAAYQHVQVSKKGAGAFYLISGNTAELALSTARGRVTR
jgi:hypothetical protein